MHNEQFPSVPDSSVNETEEDPRLRMDRLHIRRETKNLLDWVSKSPKLPNRAQVLRALEGILDLVPSKGREEDEAEE